MSWVLGGSVDAIHTTQLLSKLTDLLTNKRKIDGKKFQNYIQKNVKITSLLWNCSNFRIMFSKWHFPTANDLALYSTGILQLKGKIHFIFHHWLELLKFHLLIPPPLGTFLVLQNNQVHLFVHIHICKLLPQLTQLSIGITCQIWMQWITDK